MTVCLIGNVAEKMDWMWPACLYRSA